MSAGSPILQFQSVAVDAGRAEKGFSLNVMPGDLVWFRWLPGQRLPEVADLALGLRSPGAGRVSYLGRNWEEYDAREREQARREIGRVYGAGAGAAWVQNLDVDENIYLAQYFTAAAGRKEVEERAAKMGRRLALDPLPATRPSVTPQGVLTRAQWVRAFLPDPLMLLILEHPTLGLRLPELTPLAAEVDGARASGTAILWIDFDEPPAQLQGFTPTHLFKELPEALSDGP